MQVLEGLTGIDLEVGGLDSLEHAVGYLRSGVVENHCLDFLGHAVGYLRSEVVENHCSES